MKTLTALLNVGFVIIIMLMVMLKLRGQFPVTKKYRAYAHRDCNIKAKLNHKVLLMFHNLKNYDTYFIMQELVNLI